MISVIIIGNINNGKLDSFINIGSTYLAVIFVRARTSLGGRVVFLILTVCAVVGVILIGLPDNVIDNLAGCEREE